MISIVYVYLLRWHFSLGPLLSFKQSRFDILSQKFTKNKWSYGLITEFSVDYGISKYYELALEVECIIQSIHTHWISL